MTLPDRCGAWVALTAKRTPKELHEHAAVSRRVVEIIKAAVNNPAVTILLELSKAPLQDAERGKLSSALMLLSKLLEAGSVQGIADLISQRSPLEQDALYFKISGQLLAALHDNQLKQSSYDLVMQAYVTDAKTNSF